MSWLPGLVITVPFGRSGVLLATGGGLLSGPAALAPAPGLPVAEFDGGALPPEKSQALIAVQVLTASRARNVSKSFMKVSPFELMAGNMAITPFAGAG